ncbi:MAG TPA: sigma-70 family RNA polymerase sigma factor, partial [Candidatus Limnocylindrales bacterium]
ETFVRHLEASLDPSCALAAVILGDRAEAEEATHDAVCAAWRGIGRLRDPDRVEAWFGRILVNACRDRLRRRKVRPVGVPLDGGRILGSVTEDAFDRLATDDALGQALRRLSPEHRAVIALRFWADLPIEEIAARTGDRAGTVKSRLHYAISNLRAACDHADADRRTGR